MTSRSTALTGAVFAFLAVSIGAFAAHGLRLEGYSAAVFETGVKYQFYHALALMIISSFRASWFESKVAVLWIIGIILFSGSLYGIVLLDEKRLGMITPLGGICFLVGWFVLGMKIYSSKE